MVELSAASGVGSVGGRGRLFAPALVFLLTFLTFARALNNEFVDWDDELLLVNNAAYRGLGWPHIKYAFTTFLSGPYQPLSWISYSVDWSFWGLKPFGFHLTNILRHSAAATVFYFLSRRLIGLASPALSAGWIRFGAVVAALAFAVHPLRVESVVWAAERRDVLSGLMFALTLLAYLHYVAAAPGRRAQWYLAAVFLYLTCLLCKAMAMTLPIVLLILDVYPIRRLGGEAGWWRGRRTVWLEKLPFLLLAIATAVVALIGQRKGALLQTLDTFGPMQRIATASYATCFYLWKTLIPSGLMAMYERPLQLNPYSLKYVACIALVIVATILIVGRRRRQPGLCAAWAFFLVTLAPVSGLVQSGAQIAADRYTYMPMMGFAVLAGGLVASAMQRHHVWLTDRGRWIASGVVAILVVWVGVSVRQTGFWENSIALWKRALDVDPNCAHAYSNLALQYDRRGDLPNALSHAEKSVQLWPADGLYWQNYGVFLQKSGRTAEALIAHRKGVEASPKSAEVVTEYAAALFRAGQFAEAEPVFEQALTVDPNFPKALIGLGVLTARRGDISGAETMLQRALQSMELPAEAFLNVASAWFAIGQSPRAVDALRAGLRRYPDDEAISLRLAWVLSTHPQPEYRNGPEAVGLARPIALRSGPRQAIAMTTLAAAHAEEGDFEHARRAIAQVIEWTTDGGRQPVAPELAAHQAEIEAGRPIRKAP